METDGALSHRDKRCTEVDARKWSTSDPEDVVPARQVRSVFRLHTIGVRVGPP